ncbi:MAG TPA: prepilin-type N-terminal cleavage/methylation domain-containing protein [Candidatus Omnitrophota bacterium]|nr:prepilin-type N-terminal cleavage/methylation domain-containing protein [Candidatus Omnitrophota bacterium]
MKLNRRSGFTLLEIIIVIIIVGVLASLALPRFFSTVEFSRSTEALTSMSTVRQSIERCYIASNNNYSSCIIGAIDVENPGISPGAHFTYVVTVAPTTFRIVAQRNAVNAGDGTSTISLGGSSGAGVARSGSGVFVGIK